MKFIKSERKESLRSGEEYGIEILLIGVVLIEYVDYGRRFKINSGIVLNLLNRLREKDRCKVNVDTIRGKFATNILLKSIKINKKIDFEDFKLVIKWLKATGDFIEEFYRLEKWTEFLKNKDSKYVKNLLDFSISNGRYLYKEGKNYLGKYTENVSSYLESYKENHKNKEDIIYCGKGEIQYFFNMISAEIMNKIYKKSFLECRVKKAFIPACMRQRGSNCLSERTNSGYKCKGCSKECNVNKLTKLGENKG